MNDTHDLVALATLEDDLCLLEQQAKLVISGVARPSMDVAKRVEALQQASALYAQIRRIRDKVHGLRGQR